MAFTQGVDMTDIEQFVDVDLQDQGFETGLKPSNEKDQAYLDGLESFGNVMSRLLVPMSEWSNYEDAWKVLRAAIPPEKILNQKQEPSCASFAQIQAMQTRGYWQYGDDMIELSPISLYHRVRLRGGGSFIGDNLKQSVNPGILPLDTPENREKFDHVHPMNGENKRLPSGWEATAKYCQVESYLRISTPEEWFAALLNRFPINYGRDGHAICSVYPILSRRNWVFGYANSWHKTWGDKGFGFDSLGKIRNCTGYAVMSVTVNDDAEPIALHESQSETRIT